MPRHSEEPARSAAQRRADLEKAAALRAELMLRLSAIFQVWRECERKPCRRAGRCAGPCLATCVIGWSRRYIDDASRAGIHAAVKARLAGASVAEAIAESERVEALVEAERLAARAAAPLTPPASSPRMPPGRCRIL